MPTAEVSRSGSRVFKPSQDALKTEIFVNMDSQHNNLPKKSSIKQKYFCESHWDDSELIEKWKKHAKKSKTTPVKKGATYSLDDCINTTHSEKVEDVRLENSIWRSWYQKRYNLPKASLDLSSLQKLKVAETTKRRVSFKETVDQRIIPSQLEEYFMDDDEKEEPSLLEHIGTFILHGIVGISSFLSPYSI